MRLRSLELNNFRAFPDGGPAISLDHDAVLLYGRNGVGKTTLFDAIELALTGTIRRLHHALDSPVLMNVRRDSAPASVRLVANGSIAARAGHADISLQRLLN